MRLILFQHAFKAHKDNEPDGSIFATEAEANTHAGEVARESLGNWFESDDTADVIDALADALEIPAADLAELAAALDARPVGASPEDCLKLLADDDAVKAAVALLDGFESAVYESAVTIGDRDDLQSIGADELAKTVEQLHHEIAAGIEAAQGVVDNWAEGDLAGAVNGLEDWAANAADLVPDDILAAYGDDEEEDEEEEDEDDAAHLAKGDA